MFGMRTPEHRQQPAPKKSTKPQEEKGELPSKVRLSVGEIEARASVSPSLPYMSASQPEGRPARPGAGKGQSPVAGKSGSCKERGPAVTIIGAEKSPKKTPSYANRTAEAKACLVRAKLHLSNSRNLKGEIKTGIQEALDRLYTLVKEAEDQKTMASTSSSTIVERGVETIAKKDKIEEKIMKRLEDHEKRMKENTEEMEKLTGLLKTQQELMQSQNTYASVVAGSPRRHAQPEATAMHSIIIASKDDQETGDQVYERIRKVVNAKEEGIRIDRIRKVKDRKIIVGCRSRDEIRKIRDSIAGREEGLSVEEIKNKDPLVILYGVLQSNTDDDVVKAIRAQNRQILRDVREEDDRIEIRYRRRARNPLTSHIVARVSPRIWQCLTGAGAVHIDMQRVRVADQSPLVQCSRCLGYGHGKRFCTDAVDVCSHCGGEHLRGGCPEWLTDSPPCCINCTKARNGRTDHNAFSSECAVRRKWDSLARSTVAYC